MRVQLTNSQRCELQEALIFKPWPMVTCGEGTNEERSHNHIVDSGITRLEGKSQKLRFTNSREHEI
jgi:hypothetical protein